MISVQRWGEYYTVISEMTLSEAQSGKVLWRATALSDVKPQLHYVKLCVGANAATPEIRGESDAFRYEAEGGSSFELRRGVEYVIDVRGPEFMRRGHRSFVL